MLASINPLGERARNQRYWVTVTAYVVASTLAGALLGGVLGFVGSAARGTARAPWSSSRCSRTVGLVIDARTRVPGPRRQVDENWLANYRGLGLRRRLRRATRTRVPDDRHRVGDVGRVRVRAAVGQPGPPGR